MYFEIRKLTPDVIEDYVHFFDVTPHADNKEEHRCYCVWWCSEDYTGKDLTTSPEKRREYAIQCIKKDAIQGYLAYSNDEVVGWCNANTKMDCLECYCWRRFMGAVPTEKATPEITVKSIFCLAISPKVRRQGVASLLVERVCLDAANDGFDFVEAYPNKEFIDEAEDFMGPVNLYKKKGFTQYYETEEKFVMRKQLK